MTENCQRILSAVQEVLGPGPHPLHSPVTSSQDSQNVLQALESSSVSAFGEFGVNAESELRRLQGTEFGLLTSSGTAALHLALLAFGVGPGDKVICPAVSFVATANAIRYVGATPLFCDIEEDDLAISPSQLRKVISEERGECGISAIVAVAVFGLAPKLLDIQAIGAEFGIPVLIDGAGALGSRLQGQPLSKFGDATITSFNGNKIITAGAGGFIATDDPEVADRARHLSRVAKISHPYRYIHDELGYNYRMPELNAALLLDQLRNLPDILKKKQTLLKAYETAFRNLPTRFFRGSSDSAPNQWLISFVAPSDWPSAHEICDHLTNAGIGARPLWDPLFEMPHLRHEARRREFPVAKTMVQRCVSLPSGPGEIVE